MKRKKIVAGLLISLVGVLFSAVGVGCAGAKTIGNGGLQYSYVTNYAYGEAPDLPVVIDGNLDEQIWQTKNYLVHTDSIYGVTTHFTAFMSEGGVYVGAWSEDKNLYNGRADTNANNKNYTNRNTGFYIRVCGESDTTQGLDYLKSVQIDINNVLPSDVRVNMAGKASGVPGSGESEGFSVEGFFAWEDLNVDVSAGIPEKIRAAARYRYFPTFSVSAGVNVLPDWQHIDSDNPQKLPAFDKDGYIAADEEGDFLGDAVTGASKSAGWDLSRKEEGVIVPNGYGLQHIYVRNAQSENYRLSMKVRAGVRNTGTTYVGFMAYRNIESCDAVYLDARKSNQSGTGFTDGRLIVQSFQPNGTHEFVDYGDGSAIDYSSGEETEFTVIKKGGAFYYIINGKLMGSQYISRAEGAVIPGIMTYDFNGEIYDCSYTDYDGREDELDALISEYAYNVRAEVLSGGGSLDTDVIAVSDDGTQSARFEINARSGYRVKDIFCNGDSILDVLLDDTAERNGNAFRLYPEEDVTVSAEFEPIPDSDEVFLTGTVYGIPVSRDPSRKTSLPDVSVTVRQYSPDGEEKRYLIDGWQDITRTDGSYSFGVPGGYGYELTYELGGYSSATIDFGILEQDVEKDVDLNANLLGGTASNGSITLSTDLSKWTIDESSSVRSAIVEQNENNGLAAYFSGNLISDTAVIEVTIKNITDPSVYPNYNRDPSVGIRISNSDSLYTSVMLCRTGIRILDSADWNPVDVFGLTDKDIASVGDAAESVTLRVARRREKIFVFIDGEMVYSAEISRVSGDAGYALAFSTSSPLTVQYTDYSIMTGDAAEEWIRDNIYAPVIIDSEEESLVAFRGLERFGTDYYFVKGSEIEVIPDSIAEDVYVETGIENEKEKILLNEGVRPVKLTMPMEACVLYVRVMRGTRVSGFVHLNNSAVSSGVDVSLISEQGNMNFRVENSDGTWSVILPDGSYAVEFSKAGYYTRTETFNVTPESGNWGVTELIAYGTQGGTSVGGATTLGIVTLTSDLSGADLLYDYTTQRFSLRMKDQTGVANNQLLFTDLTGRNVMISFSAYVTAAENDDSSLMIGVEAINASGGRQTVRFASNGIRLADTAGTASGTLYTSRVTSVNVTGNTTYGALNHFNVYNPWNGANAGRASNFVFIRRENTYYLFSKYEGESDYRFIARFDATNPNFMTDDLAWGLSVAASESKKAAVSFTDFSSSTDAEEIDAWLVRAETGSVIGGNTHLPDADSTERVYASLDGLNASIDPEKGIVIVSETNAQGGGNFSDKPVLFTNATGRYAVIEFGYTVRQNSNGGFGLGIDVFSQNSNGSINRKQTIRLMNQGVRIADTFGENGAGTWYAGDFETGIEQTANTTYANLTTNLFDRDTIRRVRFVRNGNETYIYLQREGIDADYILLGRFETKNTSITDQELAYGISLTGGAESTVEIFNISIALGQDIVNTVINV